MRRSPVRIRSGPPCTLSSAGRARPSHGRGRRFESCRVHPGQKSVPAHSFLPWCKAERCFAIAKPRAGVASEFFDEKIRLVTTTSKKSECGIVVLHALRVRKTRVRFSALRPVFDIVVGEKGPVVKWYYTAFALPSREFDSRQVHTIHKYDILQACRSRGCTNK